MEKEVIEKSGFTLTIEPDEDSENPEAWGNDDCFLVAGHRDFHVDHKFWKKAGIKLSARELRDSLEEGTKEDPSSFLGTYHIFGIEAYIHSYIVLAISNEGGFPDRKWDVSQLGYVLVEKDGNMSRVKAKAMAEGLIGNWNIYLSGDIWRWKIEKDNGEFEDACSGYYGVEHCREEAMSALNHAVKEAEAKACLKTVASKEKTDEAYKLMMEVSKEDRLRFASRLILSE
jgi:hypothetical protein